MKKKLLTIIILGCMAVSMAACSGNKDVTINNQNQAEHGADKEAEKKEPGILKSKTERRSGDYTRYYEYDKNGYEIKYISTHEESGNIMNHVEKVYDENGNLLEENPIVSQHSSDYHIGYEYDEYGNLVMQFYFTEDGQKGSAFREFVYVYDEHNNVISKTTIEGSSSVTYTTEITYDENGYRTYALEKDEKGNSNREFEWTYHENGKIKQSIERQCYKGGYTSIRTIDYDESGREIRINVNNNVQEWEYSKEGYLVSEKEYNDEEGSHQEYKYTYNEEGKLVTQQTISDREGSVYCTLEHEYDETGKLVKITFLNQRGHVNYYTTFEYNENGDLIKECDQTDDEVFGVIEYTYYE